MNVMELEQYIKEYDTNEDKKIIINEKISKAKREQEFFVSLFPRSKINDIEISDYVLGKSDGKDKTFSYLIEFGSTTFGKIGAASALKFVVYYSQKKQKYDYSEQFKSHTEAYDTTIKLIAQCVNEAANAIESKNWKLFDFHISQLIELSDGTPPIAVISKIIAMYFPDEFIRIWSHRWLNNALDIFQIKREHLSEGQKAAGFYKKMEQLMKFKNSHKIMQKWSNAYFSYVIGAYLKSKIEIEEKSRLLNFLKFKMKMKANYQPIVIKMLLEDPNHTITIHDIRKKFDELNFDRGNFVSSTGKAMGNDAIDSVKKALKKYVQFPEGTSDGDVILIEKNYDESYRDECLKICGQKIAKWHIDEIQRDKLQDGFTIWGTQPGSRDSDYEYLDEFLKTNSIGCGWNKFGNLSAFPQKSDAWEFIRKEYPEEVNKQTATTFSHDIKKKDIIVLTKGQSEIIDFGIVISDYEYVSKEEEESYAHRRRVVWLNRGSIKKENLPDGLMSGMVATINPMREQERIDSMIDVLLEEKIETKNYFIITSYPDSKYGDKEGKEYEFPSHIPDAKLFETGTNFIVQTRIDDQNHFVGYGKVKEITKKQVTNEKGKSVTMCTANYSQYREFFTPKLRTSEIKDKMQWIAFPNTGNGVILPSMLRISHSLYGEIMGEYLTHNETESDTVNLNNPDPHLEKLYKILERKKQIIFYGPPGTGKTFSADKLKDYILSKNPISSNNPTKPTLLDSQNWIFVTSEEHWNILKSKKVWGSIAKPENIREKIHPGDKVIFYVKGSKLFKGSFEFQDDWYPSESGIWTDESTVDYKSQINLKELEYFDVDINILKETESYKSKLENGWPENKIISLMLRSTNGYPANNATPISETDYKKICSVSSSVGSTIVNNQNFSKNVTFHQSYSYEDFVEGIRPVIKSDKVVYEPKDGIFKEICEFAKNDSKNKYVLTIDEINRGNVSKIFGELITLIESDKRKEKYQVTLPYTRKLFWIPENLFIIGTMNTADRSIAQLDTALRRRFAFEELMPEYTLKDLAKSIDGISLKDLLSTLNSSIRAEGPQFRDKQIGHSYFMDDCKNIEDLRTIFAVEIIPLLQDYFYHDYKKLEEKILNSDFIDSSKDEIKPDWKTNDEIFKAAINKILASN